MLRLHMPMHVFPPGKTLVNPPAAPAAPAAEDMQVLRYQFNQTCEHLVPCKHRSLCYGVQLPVLALPHACHLLQASWPPLPSPADGAHWDDLDVDEGSGQGLGGGSVRVATVLLYLSGQAMYGCRAHSWPREKQRLQLLVQYFGA